MQKDRSKHFEMRWFTKLGFSSKVEIGNRWPIGQFHHIDMALGMELGQAVKIENHHIDTWFPALPFKRSNCSIPGSVGLTPWQHQGVADAFIPFRQVILPACHRPHYSSLYSWLTSLIDLSPLPPFELVTIISLARLTNLWLSSFLQYIPKTGSFRDSISNWRNLQKWLKSFSIFIWPLGKLP